MIQLDFTQIQIKHLITHHIGNKLRDEKVLLSNNVTQIKEETKDFLLKYFLLPLKTEEFYNFSHTVDLKRNDVYSIVEKIFSITSSNDFIEESKHIANLLYEKSNHPKIKKGELNIVHFTNIHLNDKSVQGVGIFKSETNSPFLKMLQEKENFYITHEYGFELKGVEKGCIIFNVEKESGYKSIIIDNSNKSEAQYWKESFLNIKPANDEYHFTKEFLGITKQFVTKQLSEDFEVTKADQIDYLNKSVDYFKSHDVFDKDEFEKEVFNDNNVIESFKRFDSLYRQDHEIELMDEFEISDKAVKKQARAFKSVLKLDKNFHIYIHGNRDLIEQGIDVNGRKYYKIYYDEER